jgi:hypothetical protein
MRNQQFIDSHPLPFPDDPVQSLRHALSVLAGRPDDYIVLETSTTGIYPPELTVDGRTTGLTMGHLRRIAELFDHYLR